MARIVTKPFERDYMTGNTLAFDWGGSYSDGYIVMQAKRRPLRPRSKGVGKGPKEDQPGGRTAILQALRYHFGKSCYEIAQLVYQDTSVKRLRKVSAMTLANHPDQGWPWWRRKYKNEAIRAAGKLLQGGKK